MNRIPLSERLPGVGAQADVKPSMLAEMTLRDYAAMLRAHVPDAHREAERLESLEGLRADGSDALADIIYRAAALSDADTADSIVYDLLVAPFLKIMEGGKRHG